MATGENNPKDPKKGDPTDAAFSIDNTQSGVNQMPSVTKLLNRKSLGNPGTSSGLVGVPKYTPPSSAPSKTSLTQAQTQQVPAPAPAAPAAPTGPAEITIEGLFEGSKETSLPTAPSLVTELPEGLTVQAAPKTKRKRGTKSAPALLEWDLEALSKGEDPLGHGLNLLFTDGAKSALFLSIHPPTEQIKAVHFIAKAAIHASQRAELWKGLCWDPGVVPELWAYFAKNGFAELPPPGTMTNLMSARNVVRGTFGLGNEEWLALIQVGSAAACRGILAIISQRSLIQQLADIRKVLSQPVPVKSKKAA